MTRTSTSSSSAGLNIPLVLTSAVNAAAGTACMMQSGPVAKLAGLFNLGFAAYGALKSYSSNPAPTPHR